MENSVIKFKDTNFKLAVINELMYIKKMIRPPFDIWAYAKTFSKRKIDVEKEGYEVIQEAKDYYLNIEITPEMAKLITQIAQDGGDDVYMNIIPFWDGEDDEFNIKSAIDAKHFPNLESVTLFYDDDDSILKEFQDLGVRAAWL